MEVWEVWRSMSRPLHPIVRIVCLMVAGGLLATACGGNQGYASLSAQNPVAELPEGLSVSANPSTLPADFRVLLTAVPAEAFAAGTAGEPLAAALRALPGNLKLQSALYKIQTQGTWPGQLYVAVV